MQAVYINHRNKILLALMFAFLLSGSENTPLLPGPFILSISEQTWDINTYKYWGFFSSAEWAVIKKKLRSYFCLQRQKINSRVLGLDSSPLWKKRQGCSLYSLKGFLEGPRVRVQQDPWLTSLSEVHASLEAKVHPSWPSEKAGLWLSPLPTVHDAKTLWREYR